MTTLICQYGTFVEKHGIIHKGTFSCMEHKEDRNKILLRFRPEGGNQPFKEYFCNNGRVYLSPISCRMIPAEGYCLGIYKLLCKEESLKTIVLVHKKKVYRIPKDKVEALRSSLVEGEGVLETYFIPESLMHRYEASVMGKPANINYTDGMCADFPYGF